MRWLYHLSATGSVTRAAEGFVHCSYLPDVADTVRLHFAGMSNLRLLRIDPRRVEDLRLEDTPRGPMPHVHGEVPADAVSDSTSAERPDVVTGTRFAVVGFVGMTLLDLVGVLDPLSRIGALGIDGEAAVEVVSATAAPWTGAGATFAAARVRPPLEAFDVLVVAGGPETRRLEHDDDVIAWLQSFPPNRIAASVCTGALLLGAAGRLRGKRATTHHASLDLLPRYGAHVSPGRVVRDGQLFTGGGVTAAIDVGLALAEHLYGVEARQRIAVRMEYPPPP